MIAFGTDAHIDAYLPMGTRLFLQRHRPDAIALEMDEERFSQLRSWAQPGGIERRLEEIFSRIPDADPRTARWLLEKQVEFYNVVQHCGAELRLIDTAYFAATRTHEASRRAYRWIVRRPLAEVVFLASERPTMPPQHILLENIMREAAMAMELQALAGRNVCVAGMGDIHIWGEYHTLYERLDCEKRRCRIADVRAGTARIRIS